MGVSLSRGEKMRANEGAGRLECFEEAKVSDGKNLLPIMRQ
jgi:hypothetical protein